jgi:cytochrome oxidase Cu insertion factor (SCO1/SenC/PrrC family)
MRTWLFTLTLLSTSLAFAQDNPRKQTGQKSKKVAVEKGKKAPDFTATDDKGKTFKFSEFMKKGDKNVVLIFSRGAF